MRNIIENIFTGFKANAPTPKHREVLLEIKTQQLVKSYLQYSLPLCVILTDTNYHPWVLENFIQIKSFPKVTDSLNCLKYSLDNAKKNDPLNMEYQEVLDISKNNWESIEDPIQYIEQKICSGTYLYCELNEYYISDKNSYKNRTHIHRSLVYGFNSTYKIFYAIGFGKGSLFRKLEIRYKELLKAVSINKCVKKPKVNSINVYEFCLIKSSTKYPFSLKKFKEIINNHLKSTQDYLSSNGLEWDYGFHCYDVIFENLKNVNTSSGYVRYNVIHMLSDHKSMFESALKYICSENGLMPSFTSIIKEASDLSQMFEELRVFYFDNSVRLKTYPMINDIEVIKELYKRLKEAVNAEYMLLNKILAKI